jgi:hypothetical protein
MVRRAASEPSFRKANRAAFSRHGSAGSAVNRRQVRVDFPLQSSSAIFRHAVFGRSAATIEQSASACSHVVLPGGVGTPRPVDDAFRTCPARDRGHLSAGRKNDFSRVPFICRRRCCGGRLAPRQTRALARQIFNIFSSRMVKALQDKAFKVLVEF